MSPGDYFPEIIQKLPAFEGQFEAFRLAADHCDVLLSSYPAGTVVTAHSHDTENVGIVTRGVLLLTMRGKTEKFGTGEWYHVPKGAEHAAEFPEDAALNEFWFSS